MRQSNDRILIAVALIGFGLIMLLDNLVDLPWQLRYRILTWQTLLVVIGLIQMIKGKPGAGVILIILGIIFWIDEYGYYDWSELWPLILIGIGRVLFLRSRGHKNVHYRGTDGEYIDNLAIFGGTNKVITDRSFKGCLLYTSPSPRDGLLSRMPSSA